jgi:hypothetical protein
MQEPTDLYIALISAAEICLPDEWPGGVALYYDPGSVSTHTWETLSYCFLQTSWDGSVEVLSRDDCSLSGPLTTQAINRLDQERRRVEANLPDDWPAGIHPATRQWTADVYRLCFWTPDDRFFKNLRRWVEDGKPLTQKQIASIKRNHGERGNTEGLHSRKLIRWRLQRLAELDLKPDDRATVSEFLYYARTIEGLLEHKQPVIGALEYKYQRQRLEATRWRAREILALLGEPLPVL